MSVLTPSGLSRSIVSLVLVVWKDEWLLILNILAVGIVLEAEWFFSADWLHRVKRSPRFFAVPMTSSSSWRLCWEGRLNIMLASTPASAHLTLIFFSLRSTASHASLCQKWLLHFQWKFQFISHSMLLISFYLVEWAIFSEKYNRATNPAVKQLLFKELTAF